MFVQPVFSFYEAWLQGLEAGLTSGQMLALLSESLSQLPPRAKIISPKPLLEGLTHGIPISHTMKQQAFPSLETAFIALGEEMGNIIQGLRPLVTLKKQQQTALNQLQQALLYPGLLTIMTLLLVIGLCTWVIPQFSEFFSQLGKTLPWPTLLLLKVVHGIGEWGLFMIGLVTLLFLEIRTSSQYWQKWQNWKHHYWAHWRVVQQWHQAQITQWLASCLASGISLGQALILLTSHYQNPIYLSKLRKVQELLGAGQAFSQACDNAQLFSASLISFLSHAETLGNLPQLMSQIAQQQQQAVQQIFQRALFWAEPLLLIGISSMIGIVLVTLYLPIFQLGQTA